MELAYLSKYMHSFFQAQCCTTVSHFIVCLLPASVVCPSILTVEQPYFRFTYFRFGLIFVHAPER